MRRPTLFLTLLACLSFLTPAIQACGGAKKPVRKVETIERMKEDGTTEQVTVVKEEKMTDGGGNGVGSGIGSFLGWVIAIPILIVGGILGFLF